MRQLKFLKIWLSLGWILVGLVVISSVIPLPSKPLHLYGIDKCIHLFTYTIIMVWFGFIYLPGREYRNLGIGFIIMGVILELIQSVTSYRSLEVFDMLTNALGVFLGWLIARTRLSSFLIYIENKFRA